MTRSRGDEEWCESTEEKPDETYEPDRIVVQEDYTPPSPWKDES